MTRGEVWLKRKLAILERIENLEVKLNLDDVDVSAGLPKPLPRKAALGYYNEKLKRYWEQAGYYMPTGIMPSLKWIEYWVQKAYSAGYDEAKKEILNGKAVIQH